MAKGRRSMQWYGRTTQQTISQDNHDQVELFGVDEAGDFASPITNVPSGTLVRTFTRITAFYTDGSPEVTPACHHIIGGIRLEEGVWADSGLNVGALDLARSEGLGYEDILMMDSDFIYQISQSSNGVAEIEMSSKSKRVLEKDDLIILNLGILPVVGAANIDLTYAVDSRILINQG